MATLLGYDDVFLQHRTGDHPERPERLTSIVETLKRDGIWPSLRLVTDRVDPDQWIRTIHSQEYIDRLQSACQDQLPFIDTVDSAICPDSFGVAREAVAITLAACDMIMSKQADNGFCPLRPPGHHAEHDLSMGFCLFNNIAIGARYLQKKHGLKRILILDWDVHHGNGSQHSFERDETVFYCSLHQHPSSLYPGTGWPEETGQGPGRGFTLNLTFEPGTGDDEYLDLFHGDFLPVARDFKPDFILVSAGFDGHHKDLLAQLNLSVRAYDEMTVEMLKLAQQYCHGRFLSLLEGGYDLEALSSCVLSHVKLLLAAHLETEENSSKAGGKQADKYTNTE